MDEFTTISDETKLYTEYADTIDRLVEAYEDDKAKIFTQLRTVFLESIDDAGDNWDVNNRPERYINFAKHDWDDVGGVRIEYEPHVYLNREHPEIRLRLDIERTGKQKLREKLAEKLDGEDRTTLENAGWDVVDGSYAYLAKSVPFDIDHPGDSIRRAVQELNDFRDIVEPYIDEIVAEQHTTD